jgi:hypothetical protein
MRIGKENEQYYLSLIRRFLVTRPDATGVEIQKMLERNIMHKFTLNYIFGLRRKLLKASIRQVDLMTYKKTTVQFADFSNELLTILGSIAFGSDSNPRDRMMAARIAMEIKIRQITIFKLLGAFHNDMAAKELAKRKAQDDEDQGGMSADLLRGFMIMAEGWDKLNEKDRALIQAAAQKKKEELVARAELKAGEATRVEQGPGISGTELWDQNDPWAWDNQGFTTRFNQNTKKYYWL